MKTILGLDLGVSSIGWAVIGEDENEVKRILGMGSRIVPLNTDDEKEFITGNSISKNQKRTQRRTQRKGYDRYQQRRKKLTDFLIKQDMFDDSLFGLDQSGLWSLRAKAAESEISLKELGRVLYHLNQKRGYKSSRSDANLEKKDTDYVAAVKSRHEKLKDLNLTIGQYFYNELNKNQYYRTKDQVFPREAYIEEFDKIVETQRKFHKEKLSNSNISFLKNEVIYFQRPLKSQKDLVTICEFEKVEKINQEGRTISWGPKVAHRSSPLFQLCKIWESINNITLKVKSSENSKYKWQDRILTKEEKNKIADYLFQNEKCTFDQLLKLVNINKADVYANKQIIRGIQGNTTIAEIKKHLKDENLLSFETQTTSHNKKTYLIDKSTGEIKSEYDLMSLDSSLEKEPLYKLWHVIYSINNHDECKKTLIKKFGINEEIAGKLANIDYSKLGFGNKSNKMMRKILPYLIEGFYYSEACELAGYNHKNNKARELKERLSLLEKNSLRQPIVEKILNQMINVVNAIVEKYGKLDEIRVELARELKQSKDERYEADKRNNSNKKLNELIEGKLKELNIPISKKTIQKYKFLYPTKEKHNEARAINQCIYCGESFSLTQALLGNEFDVDHIIPKSLLFDDSQTNKVLVHRKCNAYKTNQTAYDYVSNISEQALSNYIDRVDNWYESGIISYSKMQRLKVSFEEYQERKIKKKATAADEKLWENFIDRQIRNTQYISKKAVELLNQICTKVTTTEGGVTAKLRREWGWDDVLMNLQLPMYLNLEKETGEKFTEEVEWGSNNGRNNHKKIRIKNWDKRDDHRHHAIDALVVACTKQGFIQRLNTLHSDETKDELNRVIAEYKKNNPNISSSDIEKITSESAYNERSSKLDEYIRLQRPFTTKEVEIEASKILVSFKAGKKVATKGSRKIKINGVKKVVQKDIIIPRGALSEESVYGKIKTIKKQSLKYCLENIENIINLEIKNILKALLSTNNNETKKTLSAIKKNPIIYREKKLEFIDCYETEVVINKPINTLNENQVLDIVDVGIRRKVIDRLKNFNGNAKAAFKNLESNPIWQNEEKGIAIKNVRLFTGLRAIEPVSKNIQGDNIGFVKPGNNHHVAIYKDSKGNLVEHVCTFWHAVERKRFNIPVIVKNPKEIWNNILDDDIMYPDSFLEKLPNEELEFVDSLQQNEMFLLGISKEDANEAIRINNKELINKNLYRVQKLASMNYVFRHHLETKLIDTPITKLSKKYYIIQSFKALYEINPFKIKINSLGDYYL